MPPRAGRDCFAEALQTLVVEPEYGLAWVTVPPGAIERLGVSSDDLDGVVEFPRSIEGVRMALLFREMSGGRVKVSLRSVGNVDVAAFAKRFGGGGHTKAAGLAPRGSLAEVQATVLAAARAYLGPNGVNGGTAVDRLGGAYIPDRDSRNSPAGDMDTIDRIERTLDTCVRTSPRTGGTSRSWTSTSSEGVLLLRLGGTCHGCAASTITLKQGIEVRLRRDGARGEAGAGGLVAESLEAAGHGRARRHPQSPTRQRPSLRRHGSRSSSSATTAT